MPDFWQTRMGQVFFEGTMPKIARALESIAEYMAPGKPRPGVRSEVVALRLLRHRIDEQEIAGHFQRDLLLFVDDVIRRNGDE